MGANGDECLMGYGSQWLVVYDELWESMVMIVWWAMGVNDYGCVWWAMGVNDYGSVWWAMGVNDW